MPTGVLHLKEVDTDEITLDGTLSVSGEARLKGPTVIVDNALSVGSTTTLAADTTATNVNLTGTLSVSGQTTIGGDILPDTNDAYDIGSPEFKIRDLYVSNNSIWVGDDMKISNVNGSLKFRKRKTNEVPKAILDAGANAGHANEQATADAALAHAGVTNVADMKLQHWFKFMRTLNAAAKLTDIFRDNDDDYEETSASDAWKEIADTNKIYANSMVGVGTSDPDTTLHVKGSFKVETEDDGFQLIRSSVGAADPQLIIDTKNFGVDDTIEDKTGQGCNKFTKLYRVHGTNSEGAGRDWYWGLANDDYTNISLAVSGESGGNDPDLTFTFTTTSELYCNKVYAALGGNADTATLAAAATKLETPRKINGVDFDGTQDITISASGGSVDGITSSGGKISIGNGFASPQSFLHVSDRLSDSDNGVGNGKARFMMNVNSPAMEYHGNEYGLEVGVHGSGNSSLQTVVYDHSATNTYADYNLLLQPFGGNVGIGTTNPQAKLHVESPGDTGLDIYGGDPNHPYIFVGEHYSNYANKWGMKMKYHGNSNTAWFTMNVIDNNAETNALTIHRNANVGIGTSEPWEKLHVNGNVRIAGNTHLNWADDKYMMMDYDTHYRQGFHFHANHRTLRIFSTGANGDGGAISLQTRNWNSPNQTDYGVSRMYIKSDGLVGIGTTNPLAKLHVNGSGAVNMSSAARIYFAYNDGYKGNDGNWPNASIYASSHIITPHYFVSHGGTLGASDERIKKNIVDADDKECLETLRLLKPKKYEYIDKVSKGDEPVWGFIAQEVRATLPHAARTRTDFLPNIYELATVSGSESNVITFSKFFTSNLEDEATSRLKILDSENNEQMVKIVNVIDEHSIQVEEDLTEWLFSVDEDGLVKEGNQIFVYGQEVNDFVFLQKDAIWTVATAALQEVDRQLQDTKTQLEEEKAKTASLMERYTALESRFIKLENALNI